MELDIIRFNKKINDLEHLFKKNIEHLFVENEFDIELLQQYKNLKKEVLLALFEIPIHIVSTKYFPKVRKALQKLTLTGDPFLPASDEFKEITEVLNKALDIELSREEYDRLEDEHLYSWFGPSEFIDNLVKSHLLILKTDRIPREMRRFVDEIRTCYAFQQYTAAFALCRTVLEIAVKDIYLKNKLHKPGSTNFRLVEDLFYSLNNSNGLIEDFKPTLGQRIAVLIKMTKFTELEEPLRKVREFGNEIIHGDYTANASLASEMVQRTFYVIHELYERN